LLENHHVSVGWPAAFQARSTVIEESRFPGENRREHIVKSAERTAQTVQSLCNEGPFINRSTSLYAAAAYRRGEMLAKRHRLMGDWDAFCNGVK